jgi:hypothetical protein
MLNGTDGDASAAAAGAAPPPPKPSKQPRYTKLTQQELPACKPVLDATWATFIFAAITFVMIPVGAVALVYGLKPVELMYRYDGVCAGQHGANGSNADAQAWLHANQRYDPGAGGNVINAAALSCVLDIPVRAAMRSPIFVYYELDGVYQNHRRYVRSRSDVQLKGEAISDPERQLASCKPQLYWQVRAACRGCAVCACARVCMQRPAGSRPRGQPGVRVGACVVALPWLARWTTPAGLLC